MLVVIQINIYVNGNVAKDQKQVTEELELSNANILSVTVDTYARGLHWKVTKLAMSS